MLHDNISAESKQKAAGENEPAQRSKTDQRLERSAFWSFHIAIVVYLLCNLRMIPYTGIEKWAIYLVLAAVAVWYLVQFWKYYIFETATKRMQVLALVISLLVSVSCISLQIVYICKVDRAMADIPEDGSIYLSVNMDASFTAGEGGSKIIQNPTKRVTIDHKTFEDGDVCMVEMNRTYDVSMSVGGYVRLPMSGQRIYSAGYSDKTVTFEPDQFENGVLTLRGSASIGGGYAIITLELERELTFWEVIFYTA